MKKLTSLLVLFLLTCGQFALSACGTETEGFDLLHDDDGERLRERRSRMNITVLAQGDPLEITPEDFEQEVTSDCNASASSLTGVGCVAPPSGVASLESSCAVATCVSTASLCTANRYLELAAAIDPTQIGAYLVAPQSNATKAGFYERAAYHLQSAIMVSGEALRQPYVAASLADGVLPGVHCLAADLATELPSVNTPGHRSIGALLTGNLAEATTSLREAVIGAIDRNVAEADNERARAPDRSVAHQGMWHDPVLSRARAAQLAFGSVEASASGQSIDGYGLPKSCALPPLTERGGRAREYVRTSGVDPARVREPLQPIEYLLDPATAGAGVIERVQSLLDLPDLGSGDAMELFLAAHSLSEADFVEARAHLRCELEAFPRDESEYTDIDVAGMGTVPVYRATNRAPIHNRSADAWADVLTAEARPQVVAAGVVPWRPMLAMRGAAHALDYARRISVEVTAIEHQPSPPGFLATPTADFIASVGAQAGMNTEGRLTACASSTGTDHAVTAIMHDDGSAPLDDYLVITGAAVLECLVHGNVGGDECTLDWTGERNPAVTSAPAGPSTGYARAITFNYIVEGAPSAGVRDFLVRRNPGLSGKPPGGYRLVAPILTQPTLSLTTLNVGEQLCDQVPTGTEYQDNLNDNLNSDPSEPSSAETPCEAFEGQRTPLEAELNDDGDRYETSWRRQLTIARNAAEHADQLAREYISSGLEIDSRAEAAQRELEAVCGVSVDLAPLFNDDLTDMVNGTCAGGTSCAAAGYECMGGVCVRDLSARIDSLGDESRTNRILTSCLGDASAVRPIVALGSTPLCVWQNTDDLTLLCERDAVGPTEADNDTPHPCPFPMEGGTCELATGYEYTLPGEHAVAPVTDHLEIFDAEAAEDSGGPTVDRGIGCGDVIRRLRDDTLTVLERRHLLRELHASNTITRHEAHRAAERLGWIGQPGDFGTLTINRNGVFSTGNPRRVSRTSGQRYGDSWPCDSGGAPSGVACSMGGGTQSSLLCETWDCTDRPARAEANYRVARAAATLGILSGFGMSSLELPVGTNQNAPSPPTAGAPPPADVFLYLNNDTDDVTTLIESNYAGWADEDLSEWSGRTYVLGASETGPVFMWTGRATGARIDRAPFGCDAQGICPLSLVQTPARTERDYDFFTFARFGEDDLWTTDAETRLREFSAFWSGSAAANSGVRQGEVSLALFWAGSLSHTGQTALALSRGDVFSRERPALADHTRLATEPFAYIRQMAASKGNYARLFDVLRPIEAVSNQPLEGPEGIRNEDILDALELMCFVNSPAAVALAGCDDATPPPITGEADIPAARAFLSCLAADMERAAEYAIVQNVPSVVVEAGRGESAIAPLEGEFGRAASGARETLLALREQPRALATQVRAFEADLSAFEVSIRLGDISREIIDWRLAQEAVSAAATCAEIAENQGRAGYARCGGALTNLAISFRISDLSRESVSLERQQHLIDLRTRMENRVDTVQRINAEINRLTEQLDGHLSMIGVSQRRARRLLSQTMFSASVPGRAHLEETPVVSPVNLVMRRRYNTSFERYDRARWRAHRASVLAMQSIEQRLGMSFDRMDRELPLLETTPAALASSLCAFEGVDYASIRDAGWPGDEGAPRESYVSGFIGDYVRDLEAVVDSYPYAYPYTDGTDVAVISLRDDIARVRALCPQPSYNLLAGTQELNRPIWQVVNCDLSTDPTGLCVDYRRLETADIVGGDAQAGPLAGSPPVEASPSLAVQGYRFDFGADAGSGGTVGADTAFEQTVSVTEAGTYRLSWFGRAVAAGPNPNSLVSATGSVAGAGGVLDLPMPMGTEALATGWTRYFQFIDINSPGDVVVRVSPGVNYGTSVDLGGFMLDKVSTTESAATITAAITAPPAGSDPSVYYPPAFMGADDEGLSLMAACEDTYGDLFREGWTNGREFLCPGGFAASCDPSESSTSYRYRERNFIISQRAIELGNLWTEAGFAYGNFNYRIERIGVNVVGRRDCGDSDLPTTCFASGTVPYSITHLGPYLVTNHMGEQFDAPLFVGSIDHARAVAAERYVTNPISGADRSLLDPFMRDDFNGRPLDGTFSVRLWDAPGVDFSAVEDVQLVIEYRYWNRSRTPSATE